MNVFQHAGEFPPRAAEQQDAVAPRGPGEPFRQGGDQAGHVCGMLVTVGADVRNSPKMMACWPTRRPLEQTIATTLFALE